MKFAKLLRDWQVPVRARVEDCLKVDSELSLYHQAANDEGNRGMDSIETVRERLNSIAILLRTAREKIPLSILRELYGGVDVHRVILAALFEQISGGIVRINDDHSRCPEGGDTLREMYSSASFPPPIAGPTLSRRLEVPISFRGLNGEIFERRLEVILHFDWMSKTGFRLTPEAAGGLDTIEVAILGLEDEVADIPLRMRFDCAGEPDQISRAATSPDLSRCDWVDDSIINSGREIFYGPQDDALLFSVEDDETVFSWCGEGEKLYRGLRVWTEDFGGNEELLAIGEAGIGAVYFAPNPLFCQSLLTSAL